jgi:fermentation-respiration switch protein FrsA (DUF1100 family)
LARSAFDRAEEPKQLLVLPCQHTDVYNVEPWVTQAADAAADFFTSHLTAP